MSRQEFLHNRYFTAFFLMATFRFFLATRIKILRTSVKRQPNLLFSRVSGSSRARRREKIYKKTCTYGKTTPSLSNIVIFRTKPHPLFSVSNPPLKQLYKFIICVMQQLWNKFFYQKTLQYWTPRVNLL